MVFNRWNGVSFHSFFYSFSLSSTSFAACFRLAASWSGESHCGFIGFSPVSRLPYSQTSNELSDTESRTIRAFDSTFCATQYSNQAKPTYQQNQQSQSVSLCLLITLTLVVLFLLLLLRPRRRRLRRRRRRYRWQFTFYLTALLYVVTVFGDGVRFFWFTVVFSVFCLLPAVAHFVCFLVYAAGVVHTFVKFKHIRSLRCAHKQFTLCFWLHHIVRAVLTSFHF